MTRPRLRAWSGTARRLALAFGSLIAIFSLSSWFSLRGLTEIHDYLGELSEREQAVRSALQLATAVRDQYAHQAHTIIIGDTTHLAMYGEAEERVLALTRLVRDRARSDEERVWVDEIERASRELDAIFREEIVPSVIAGEDAHVQTEHARGLMVVDSIQIRVDWLVERFERSMREVERQAGVVERTTFRWTAGALIAMVLLACGIGLYIGRSIAIPVGKLSEGAARLAGGDLETRIDVNTPDEFGRLARQFNAMTMSLGEQQEKLVQSEKLAGIGRLAAGVAHEINNPLGVILGYTRLLGRKAEGAALEDLKVIEDETLRCKEIVQGLLDLSRPMNAQADPVELRELCEEIVERLREAGRGPAPELVVTGEAAALGSASKLRQVLLNLIKNAAEAAGEAGRVEVRIGLAARGAEVRVRDSGPGLGPEARARLFEPFFTTKAAGTGLGLAVSQAIAHGHGGGIEIGEESGAGATFTLWLPAAPRPGTGQGPEQGQEQGREERRDV